MRRRITGQPRNDAVVTDDLLSLGSHELASWAEENGYSGAEARRARGEQVAAAAKERKRRILARLSSTGGTYEEPGPPK